MNTSSLSTVATGYTIALILTFAPGVATAQTPSARKPSVDAQQALAVQVALDRAGFSSGEIDGQAGAKTRLALAEYQKSANLRPSGVANEETVTALRLSAEPLVSYTIAQQDVVGPFIGKMPRDLMESSKLEALGYTTALEALAERFHSSQAFLRKVNPGAKWAAGEVIKVPDVEPFELPTKATKPAPGAIEVMVSGATKSLTVRDAAGKTLMYAPVTVGSEKDPLPVGDWKVLSVAWNPTFNYNPDLFWDADPTHAKAKIPAGPNNPVGVVWVDINKEHFGLHGTPEPSTVGRTESHGCIRLTNWDAAKLGRLVNAGTKVTIQ
ncbi:MAG: murein L,D-transpeptidase [Acidobacteria bacterium]|nr:murein L,D-transpeptidase [Acidobacteriota bacterium]